MDADSSVSVRRACEADLSGILELVQATLGRSNPRWSEDLWRWKHRENPFGASPVLVAEAKDRLVGLRAFLRWAWRTGRETVPAVRAVDTVTHPDWRGRGVFTRLTLAMVEEMEREGVAFVFNTPNRASRPGYLKMGWSAVGRLSFLARPLRPGHMALGALGLKGRASGSREEAPGLGSPVTDLLREPGLEAFLARREGNDRRYRTPVDRTYLEWRYERSPGARYEALWELSGRDGAVLVLRHADHRIGVELRICELLLADSDGSVAAASRLLAELCRGARASVVTAMAAPETPERRSLLDTGFLPAPRMGPVFTVRPLSLEERMPDPLQRQSWRASLGSLELF